MADGDREAGTVPAGAGDAAGTGGDPRSGDTGDAAFEVLNETLRSTEQRLRDTERRLRDAEDRLADVEGRYAYQVYRTEYVTWQLRSIFARRWWRLGESLWRVYRRPAQILRLPADVLRAARKMPMPEPPERPQGRPRRPRPGAAGGAVAATDHRASLPEIPEVSLPDGPVARPDLTVAVILDRFSAAAFRYEWDQIDDFGPDDWRTAFTRTRPDLLFVESAWSGNDGRWSGHMSGPGAPSAPLRELVAWCRDNGIPTVFWNKEDPPNFEVFVGTAGLFDHVFTTCGEMVPRYRETLGHDRIGVLSFAAQPRIHNPVQVPGGRRHEVAFAGTFFAHKHPARAEQMRTVLEPATGFGLHIYSRMYGGDDKFQFPPEYSGNVVGSLPYERMLAAYKAYKVFLNVNSVVDSPTMCARRLFELSACRTPILSGYSRAIEEFFSAGTVSVARSPEDTRALLAGLLASPELRDRQAHLAMREVFAAHTYAHRVDTVLAALGQPAERPRPTVSVVLATNRPDQLTYAIGQVARQRWRPLQLVLVLHGTDLDPEVVADKARAEGIDDVVVRTADPALVLGECLNLGIEAADGELIAKMDDDDIYGEHYLSDLVPAFSYTTADIVGKRACYVQLRAINATLLSKPEAEHTYTPFVRGGTLVVRGDVLRRLRFDPVPRGSDTKLLRRAAREGIEIYSADRFNYVYVRNADPTAHTYQVNDADLLKQARVEFYGPPEPHVCL